jgi:hypothetical protein
MKSNYEKYIKEVRDVKDTLYKKFKKSKYKSLLEFIKNELKDSSIKYATHTKEKVSLHD